MHVYIRFSTSKIAFCFFLCTFSGHPSEKNSKSIENTASSDVDLPDNFWEQFLLYEGCFELNGSPEKERNDPQNNNYVCNDFCKNDGKNYSATIGERCLCFSNRPAGLVSADQCRTTCPNPVRFNARSNEEDSCDGIDCCGSLTNNTMTVIQAIRIVPHRNLDKKGKTGCKTVLIM